MYRIKINLKDIDTALKFSAQLRKQSLLLRTATAVGELELEENEKTWQLAQEKYKLTNSPFNPGVISSCTQIPDKCLIII